MPGLTATTASLPHSPPPSSPKGSEQLSGKIGGSVAGKTVSSLNPGPSGSSSNKASLTVNALLDPPLPPEPQAPGVKSNDLESSFFDRIPSFETLTNYFLNTRPLKDIIEGFKQASSNKRNVTIAAIRSLLLLAQAYEAFREGRIDKFLDKRVLLLSVSPLLMTVVEIGILSNTGLLGQLAKIDFMKNNGLTPDRVREWRSNYKGNPFWRVFRECILSITQASVTGDNTFFAYRGCIIEVIDSATLSWAVPFKMFLGCSSIIVPPFLGKNSDIQFSLSCLWFAISTESEGREFIPSADISCGATCESWRKEVVRILKSTAYMTRGNRVDVDLFTEEEAKEMALNFQKDTSTLEEAKESPDFLKFKSKLNECSLSKKEKIDLTGALERALEHLQLAEQHRVSLEKKNKARDQSLREELEKLRSKVAVRRPEEPGGEVTNSALL